jgi:hypothetical protein
MLASFVRHFALDPNNLDKGMLNFVLVGGNHGRGLMDDEEKYRVSKAAADLFFALGVFPRHDFPFLKRTPKDWLPEPEALLEDLNRSIGGVLFIDDADTLPNRLNWRRTIAPLLVDFLDRHRGQLSVVFAGKDILSMLSFLSNNKQLADRVPSRFLLEPLSPSDLWDTFSGAVEHLPFALDQDATTMLFGFFDVFNSSWVNQADDVQELVRYLARMVRPNVPRGRLTETQIEELKTGVNRITTRRLLDALLDTNFGDMLLKSHFGWDKPLPPAWEGEMWPREYLEYAMNRFLRERRPCDFSSWVPPEAVGPS